MGDLAVQGMISKFGGVLPHLDHPLDPLEPVPLPLPLFVELPDMKNIYDGVAELGDDGMTSRTSCRNGSKPSAATSATSSRRTGASAPDLYIVSTEIADG